VINGVDAHGNAGVGSGCGGGQGQFGDQCSVFGFATDRCAIFAIQGDIKNAGAELLRHLGLQLQAFAHPRFDTAVMVTNRQLDASGLCSQQNVARMAHLDFSA
jgi:hypothetical protein